jgi:hypothetical protein
MSRPGSFCTSVLKTSDADRASRFYASLFGWDAKPATPDHTFFQFGGKTVASMQTIASGRDAWVPHVCVDAIDRTIETATALGATLLDVTNVAGVARMATLRDREAAVFGLWQPDPHAGAEQMDVPGSIWWVEVLARDPAIARDFYGKLFGLERARYVLRTVRRLHRVRTARQPGVWVAADPAWMGDRTFLEHHRFGR